MTNGERERSRRLSGSALRESTETGAPAKAAGRIIGPVSGLARATTVAGPGAFPLSQWRMTGSAGAHEPPTTLTVAGAVPALPREWRTGFPFNPPEGTPERRGC